MFLNFQPTWNSHLYSKFTPKQKPFYSLRLSEQANSLQVTVIWKPESWLQVLSRLDLPEAISKQHWLCTRLKTSTKFQRPDIQFCISVQPPLTSYLHLVPIPCAHWDSSCPSSSFWSPIGSLVTTSMSSWSTHSFLKAPYNFHGIIINPQFP